MSMYFVGIDISKYKHDCCIISAADQQLFPNLLLLMIKMDLSICLLHLTLSPILRI